MAEHLNARFYDHAQLNVSESKLKGIKVYNDVVMVELTIRGARGESISYAATDKHKAEYPEAWALYSGQQFTGEVGTPLNVLGEGFTLARSKEFESLGIRTVEQLAKVTDGNIMKLRDGMRAKHIATVYLEGQELAKGNVTVAQVDALTRRLEELEAQNAVLAQNQKLKPGRKPHGEDAQTVM